MSKETGDNNGLATRPRITNKFNGFASKKDRDIVFEAFKQFLGRQEALTLGVYYEEDENANMSISAIANNINYIIDRDLKYFFGLARCILSIIYDESIEEEKRVSKFGVWSIWYEDGAIVFDYDSVTREFVVANETLDWQVELLVRLMLQDYFNLMNLAVKKALRDSPRDIDDAIICVQVEPDCRFSVQFNEEETMVVSLLDILGITY